MCNTQGGIEADLTITRLAENHFYIVTGAGFGTHDSDWIRRHLPDDGGTHLIELTSGFAVINLCGPACTGRVAGGRRARRVEHAAFPFATCRNITVGAAPVRAIRIGFVGELGWELHVPTEFGAHVYETLRAAGQPQGIRDVGYRAIDTLRLEKGYVYWSGDISPDYTPIEAGLGFRVHLKSGGNFIGREALLAQKASGRDRRISTFVTDTKLPLYGGETIIHDGQTVSLATSAGFGHSVGQTILYGYLEKALWEQTDFEVEVFGTRHPVRRIDGPVYDPDNTRLKS